LHRELGRHHGSQLTRHTGGVTGSYKASLRVNANPNATSTDESETAREVWEYQDALDGSHMLTGCGACMRCCHQSLPGCRFSLKAVGDGWG
jgi:hypothetical protein